MAKKSSLHLLALFFVLVAVLLGVLVWQPLRADVQERSAELASAQTRLNQVQAQVAEFASLESSLPVAETERKKILQAVPVGLNQDQLVEDLSAIAETVGISLNSVTFSLQSSQNSASKSLHLVSMAANFNGSYSDLVSLLKAFEGNARRFKVTSIGVQLAEVTEEGQQMNFSVSLEAYYQD